MAGAAQMLYPFPYFSIVLDTVKLNALNLTHGTSTLPVVQD